MREYRVTSKIDRKQWSDFVFNHPQGNIFQTPEMFDVFIAVKNNHPVLTAVTNGDNEIVGVLAAVIQREYSGFLGKFTSRSIIRGGPLILDNNEEVLDIILKEYNKAINKRVIYSQFRNLWDKEGHENIFERYNFKFEDHLDILIDLKQSENDLKQRMHKERKHNIRRAINKGTIFKELKEPKEIEEAIKLIQETYNRIKLPLAHQSFFKQAYDILFPKKMIRYFGAFNQEKIIGTRIVLLYKEHVYDWYAGSSYKDRNKYPNDFLPWEVVLWSKINGYKIFDFGGAGKPGKPYGVRNYKLKFGGQLVNYGRYVKIHKPIPMKIGKLGLKLWQMLR